MLLVGFVSLLGMNKLLDRCFESLFIFALMEKLFFLQDNSTQISFLHEIEGVEVEWTLGFILSHVNKFKLI